MQDRVPANPGRVLITPENGSAAYYATVTRADNPTQKGTPLNKASLLKDATAALFGLGTDAVPDDALNAIKTLINGANANADTKAKIATGSYTGTGTYGSSNKNSLTFDFEPKLLVVLMSGVRSALLQRLMYTFPLLRLMEMRFCGIRKTQQNGSATSPTLLIITLQSAKRRKTPCI